MFEENNKGQKIVQGVAHIDGSEVVRGKELKDLRQARRHGKLDEATAWQMNGCEYCAKTLEELGLKKFQVCGAYKAAQYCSKECQKNHGKNIKPILER